MHTTKGAHDPDGPTEELEIESVDLSVASISVVTADAEETARRKSSTPPPLPAEALRLRATPIPPAADLKARLKPPTPLAQRATPVPAAGPGRLLLRTAALSGEQIEALQAEVERLTKRLNERDAYLGELERVYAQRADALLAAEKDVETLRAELEARNARVAQLEAALAARSPLSKHGAEPDDLTRIRGIGPRYARQLQELGVQTFAAISAWTADECAHFARQLKMNPGRVERDRWVEQARVLCETESSAKPNEPDL